MLVPGDGADRAEIASLDQAAAMWNRLGQTRLSTAKPEPAGETPDATAARPADPILEVRFETAAPVFHGLYDDEHGVVYINHRLADPHQRAVTVAHEVGHALGLFHITARASVMNPANLEIEPDREDAGDLQALWGECPPASAAASGD